MFSVGIEILPTKMKTGGPDDENSMPARPAGPRTMQDS